MYNYYQWKEVIAREGNGLITVTKGEEVWPLANSVADGVKYFMAAVKGIK